MIIYAAAWEAQQVQSHCTAENDMISAKVRQPNVQAKPLKIRANPTQQHTSQMNKMSLSIHSDKYEQRMGSNRPLEAEILKMV